MQIRRHTIDPGSLRHLITVQSKPVPETRDGFGAPVEIWSDSFKVYAAYQPVGSREFQEKWKQVAESTARFLIRYRDDIDSATQRIIYNGQVLDITGFQEADDRRMFAYVETKVHI